jgi:hypothetical protein
MARVGFIIASLASLVFLVWFLMRENRSPGLSIGIALIAMPLMADAVGLLTINAEGIAKDGKRAGLAAMVIAFMGVGYFALFFCSWLLVALLWYILHLPMIIGIVSSPTSKK